MRYYSSGRSHNHYKPKTNWRSLGRKKTKQKTYRQYEEAATLRYANPFGGRTSRKKKALPLKGTIVPLLFISWVGLLLYLPFFKITKHSYTGLKFITSTELENEINSELRSRNPLWPVNNYFLINEHTLESNLQSKYALNSVTVSKVFPDSLNVMIQEKVSSAIYDNAKAYYLIDEQGTAIKYLRDVGSSEFTFSTTTIKPGPTTTSSLKLSNIPTTTAATTNTSTTSTVVMTHTPNYAGLAKDYGNYPIVYDLSQKAANEKMSLLDTGTIKGLIAFYNELQRGSIAKVRYFTVSDKNSGVTVFTDKPWKIYFDPAADIATQISNLQIFVKNSHPTEYVDLRLGERIYWK